jgi:heterokaryon incompatibility protein (HET)
MKEKVSSMDLEVGDLLQEKLSEFKPTPLRMLRSRQTPDFITSSKDKPVNSFIALSYCWHTSEWTLTESLKSESEKHKHPISQKLWNAFNLMRNGDDEAVWVDQLCIDQGNSKEKHNAIAEMDLVYGSARQVVVALEDITISRQAVRLWNRAARKLQAVDSLDAYQKYDLSDGDVRESTKLLATLFSARWFTRSWCMHEYLLASDCIFLVPCENDVVLLPSTTIMAALLFRLGASGFFSPKVLSLANGFTYKYSHQEDRSIMDLFFHLNCRMLSIVSDNLAILLNISGLSLEYVSETASVDENCYITTLLSLAMEDAVPLCNDGPHLRLSQIRFSRLEGLSVSLMAQTDKSWMQFPSIRFHPHKSVQMDNPTSITVEGPFSLTLDLYILSGKPVYASESSRQKAAELLQFEPFVEMKLKIGNGIEQEETRTTALAITLDLGLDWVVQNSVYEKYFESAEELGVHKLIGELMHLRHDIINALWTGVVIREASQKYDGDLEVTILRYIVRLLLFNLPLNSWVDLGEGTGGRAACTVAQKDIILVIPYDLAGSKFSRLKRLWLLKQADPEIKGLWRMQGKSILLGYSDLQVGGGLVSLARKQKLIA